MGRPLNHALRANILRAVILLTERVDGAYAPDATQLAAFMGEPYPTVAKVCGELRKAGLLDLWPDKFWLRVTPQGRAALAMVDGLSR